MPTIFGQNNVQDAHLSVVLSGTYWTKNHGMACLKIRQLRKETHHNIGLEGGTNRQR